MKKKMFLVTLLMALFAIAVASVSAAPASPAVETTVCVGLQSSRQSGWNEPVAWELRLAGTATVAYTQASVTGGATATIATPPSIKGCFPVIGVPGTAYDLRIKGADHLRVAVPSWTYPAGGTTDLSATVILKEGDANNSNTITLADLNTAKTALTTPNSAADFNENGTNTLTDLNIVKANLGQSGPASANVRTPLLDEISFMPATVTGVAGETKTVDVYINTDRQVSTLQVGVNVPSALTSPMLALDSATITDVNFYTGAGIGKSGTTVAASITGSVKVATLTFTLPASCAGSVNETVTFVAGDAGAETGSLFYDTSLNIVAPATSSLAVSCPDTSAMDELYFMPAAVTGVAGQTMTVEVRANTDRPVSTIQVGVNVPSGLTSPMLALDSATITDVNFYTGAGIGKSGTTVAASITGDVKVGMLTFTLPASFRCAGDPVFNVTFVQGDTGAETGSLFYDTSLNIVAPTLSPLTVACPSAVGLSETSTSSNNAMGLFVIALMTGVTFIVVRRRQNG